MFGNNDYVIQKDVKFGFLNLIDVAKIRDSVTDDWFNQTLCQVNDCVVRIGVLHGEFHWHHHEKEDEFFYVRRKKSLRLPCFMPLELAIPVPSRSSNKAMSAPTR